MAHRAMGKTVVVKAPAKINLHLEVADRRPDGYHEILSLFQAVTLRDVLRIRSLKGNDALEVVGGPEIPAPEHSVARAVEAFRRATGLRDSLWVELDKRIPVGAGLGGGSSDAAATLRGLELLYPGALQAGSLPALAAELGSDVPFFLHGAAALVEGRGERLLPLSGRGDFSVVLACPGFPVLTREAYLWLDQRRRGPSALRFSVQSLSQAYLESPLERWEFFNDFQQLLEERFPLIGELTRQMGRLGACLAAVTGSGSAVFGVFAETERAQAAARKLGGSATLVEVVGPEVGGIDALAQ